MGTNYYLEPKPACECCKREYQPLHIGKSSAGWCFSLHVIPEMGLNDADSWFAACAQNGSVVKDEYGDTVTISELIDVICNRKWIAPKHVPLGYTSMQHFYRANQAEPGPNGLMRHQLDGQHCIAHGDKTWDACTGDFC